MSKTGTGKAAEWQLYHIGIVVRDLDKAVKYYESLGFGPFPPPHLSLPEGKTVRGKPAGHLLKVTMASMGPIELEIVQHVSGDCCQKEFLDNKGEGVNHLGFRVEDFDKERAELERRGIKMIQGGLKPSGLNSGYFDTDKVGGVQIELLQSPKKGSNAAHEG